MQEKHFTEHLDDLRTCAIRALIGVLSGFVASLILISNIFALLLNPYKECLLRAGISPSGALRSLGPADSMQITIKAALVLGLGFSSPWVAYQIWQFIAPALHRYEKRYVIISLGPAFLFFLIGAAFAYFFALPYALSFFYTYTLGLGIIPDWAIVNYYDFAITFLVAFGLIFEMPIAITIFALLGVVTPKGLATYRKHAVVGIFIIAGILTPGPDIASQLMMGLPMLALYELSIIAARIVCRRSRQVKSPDLAQGKSR